MIKKMEEVMRLLDELYDEHLVLSVERDNRSFHMFTPDFMERFKDFELYKVDDFNELVHYRARIKINDITIFCCLTKEEYDHYSSRKELSV